jgi:hypothetical protein
VSTHGDPDAYRVFGCRSDLSALSVRNNIFYSDIQIANNVTFNHSHNLYHMMVNMKSGSGVGYTLGSGELPADPYFVNLGGGDFHLQLDSPAIDTGMDLGYTNDIEGVLVPQTVTSALPDIGAYEFPR